MVLNIPRSLIPKPNTLQLFTFLLNMPKIQRMNRDDNIEMAIHNDLRFPKTDVGADYDSRWSTSSTTRDLYKIIATLKSGTICGEGRLGSLYCTRVFTTSLS